MGVFPGESKIDTYPGFSFEGKEVREMLLGPDDVTSPRQPPALPVKQLKFPENWDFSLYLDAWQSL